jgi:hypothetical protein
MSAEQVRVRNNRGMISYLAVSKHIPIFGVSDASNNPVQNYYFVKSMEQ